MTTTSVKRYGHRVELNTLETALLTRVDGKRPIRRDHRRRCTQRDRTRCSAFKALAREFFRRMAEWDHLQYEIP